MGSQPVRRLDIMSYEGKTSVIHSAGDSRDRRFLTGFFRFYSSGLVLWRAELVSRDVAVVLKKLSQKLSLSLSRLSTVRGDYAVLFIVLPLAWEDL